MNKFLKKQEENEKGEGHDEDESDAIKDTEMVVDDTVAEEAVANTE